MSAGNLGGSQVTQQGEPGVIVQQSGAVIVQQSGSASPVVQNVSSPIVQQSAPPSALVVQQSATVVQQTTTYQPSPVVNVQVQVQSSPSPSPTPSPSPSPTPSPSPSPSPTPSGTLKTPTARRLVALRKVLRAEGTLVSLPSNSAQNSSSVEMTGSRHLESSELSVLDAPGLKRMKQASGAVNAMLNCRDQLWQSN